MTQEHRPARWPALAVLLAAVVLQGVLWAGAWDHGAAPGTVQASGPLAYDYSVLTYQVQSARELFAATGRLHGTDAFIDGGFPLSFLWNSNVFLQTLAVALPGVGIGTLLTAMFWLAVLGFPAAWWGAMVLAKPGGEPLPWPVLAGGMLLGLALFRTGLSVLFLWAGMLTAALLVGVGVLVTGLFLRVLARGSVEDWFHFIAAVALGTWVHKTLLVMVACLFLGGMLFHAQRGRLLLGGVACLLVTLMVNGFWIVPMAQAWDFKTLRPDAPFWVEPPVRFLKDHFTGTKTFLTGEMPGAWGTTFVYLSAFAAGIAGAALGWRRPTHRAMWAGWLALGVLTVLGGLQGMDSATHLGATLNHYRFLIHWQTLGLLLLVLAWPLGRDQKTPAWALPAVGTAVLVLSFLPSYYRFFRNKPLTHRVPEQVVALVNETNRLLLAGGNLLLEDSGGWDRQGPPEKYYGTYLTGLMPWLTGRPQVGGPYPYMFLTPWPVSPLDGQWFGKDVRGLSDERLRGALARYNVRAALAHSPALQNALGRAGCLHRRQQDVWHLYACPPHPMDAAVLRLPGTAHTWVNEPGPLPLRATPYWRPSAGLTSCTVELEPTPLLCAADMGLHSVRAP